MSVSPRVVLGLPAYNRPDALPQTVESLLSQTFTDFALVVVDDAASAETKAIVERYAHGRPPITYEVNITRLGMIGNWRRVFQRARELYPHAEYFAWVSDHDLWHARWLQEMVAVLDAYPQVVLAYSHNVQLTVQGARTTEKVKMFETFGVSGRADRMRRAARSMRSGDMIYGLMRVQALEAAGVFHRVILPDRQVLLALSLFGQFRQVPEVLWYREFMQKFDLRRQLKAFFPHGVPRRARLPYHLQHCATLLWDFAVQGRGRPAFGRAAAVWYAALQLWWSMVREIERPKSDWRLRMSSRLRFVRS